MCYSASMNVAERQRPPAGELCLDHLAHFVPDLDAAAAVWEKLGFAVTPVSQHNVSGKPAGTSNRCVMLEEGYSNCSRRRWTRLTRSACATRMKRFVGVHLACFGTPDAAAEHARLAAHGFEPEPLVQPRKKHRDRRARLRFNVVYVPPGKMAGGPRPVLRAPHAAACLARGLRQPVSPASRLCGGGRSGGGCGALGALRRPAAAAGGRLRPPGYGARTRGDRNAKGALPALLRRGAPAPRARGLCTFLQRPGGVRGALQQGRIESRRQRGAPAAPRSAGLGC